MALVTLTPVKPDITGPNVDLFTPASAGDTWQFPNDGRVYLLTKKTTGANVILTIATAGTMDGLAIADPTVTLANDGHPIRMIGPFPVGYFNDANGNVSFTANAITDLTFAAVRF